MRKIKTLTAIMVMAIVMSFGAPQAFAGFIPTGFAANGVAESPGYAGPQESPGLTDGTAESPGFAGDIGCPGLAVFLAALFG